ncbi:CBS domain-containing protein [Mesobacillus zeae]|uniref:CBS domain-containing protein n=1 Tax=Mesobacillus zeae TaxID=1917180 RepID=A0A398BCQ5_9BACI|nr:CBS domain-containing protein [Mesobacillus zeae]RID87875.1 CBS domain-containing protein [Mesobacillus zeae]
MEKVRDMMTTDVETCTLLDNVFEVAVKMKEHDVGSIPIVDGNKLVGIMTDRDIVIRGVAEKKPPSSKVEEFMTGELITISPDASVKEAADLMAKHQIRRLPVVEGGQLSGIVALGDFAIDEQADDQAKKALTEISEHDHTIQSEHDHTIQ